MCKFVKFLIVLILILILALAFFRHTLCRFIITESFAKATGLKLFIEELNLDILANSLQMRGITLLNPLNFQDEIFAKAQQVFIKYNPWGILGRRIHLRQVKADINEINIIRNIQGRSNVSVFKKRIGKKMPVDEAQTTSAAQKDSSINKIKKRPWLQIDRLELSLKKMTFINYGAGVGQPAVIIFTTEGPFVFKNVNDLGYVVDSVSIKSGIKNLLSNLSEMVPKGLIKDTSEAIKKKVQDILPKAK